MCLKNGVSLLLAIVRYVWITCCVPHGTASSGLDWTSVGPWRPNGSSESALGWDGAELEAGQVAWNFKSDHVHSKVFRLRETLTADEVTALRSALPTQDDEWTLAAGDVEEAEKEWVSVESNGTSLHSALSALTRPLTQQRVLPFVREKYTCPTCVVCDSMMRRYNGGGRHRDPPHFDMYGFVTVVLSLTGQQEYDGPGLYVQANDPKAEHALEMNRGDLVAHQWDLRHGVRVDEGSRLSWIMWIGDTADCRKSGKRWYEPRWTKNRDAIAAFQLGQDHAGTAYGHELFKAASADGMLYALFNEAVPYAHGGSGVDKNLTLAFNLWQKAASMGFAQAQAALALKFANGEGCEKDEKAAEYWYRQAASLPAEHAQAQLLLGELLVRKGMDTEGESWIRKAAEQGVPEARAEMVKRVARRGNPKGEPAPGFLRTAARAGDSNAMLTLALHFGGKGASAVHEKVRWYTKAAAAGNAVAAQNLGTLYYNGEGSIAPNSSAALHWFELAAAAGLQDSAHAAGMLLLDLVKAHGLEKSAAVELGARAKKHLEAAADRGHLGALWRFGFELTEGTPGFGDKQEALGASWVRKAAEGGDAEAMWIWAQMAEEGGYGPGTPDLYQARKWTQKAAKAGHSSAVAALQLGGLPSSASSVEL